MKIYPFDERFFQASGELFPEEIFGDPWIAYHGTSGNRAASIETNGLAWPGEIVGKEEVAKVVQVFKNMRWCGVHTGGLPVLEPFTLLHDFGETKAKPIYLAEMSLRAFTYATKDFAGGETCRALRFCFADLQCYLNSEDIRTKHLRGEGRLWDGSTDDVAAVDLKWLRNELEALISVYERCREAIEVHQAGIVYAVRFQRSDLEHLRLHNSMGIKATCRIDPVKIVAKVVIPVGAKGPQFPSQPVRKRFMSKLDDASTLLGALTHER